MKSEAISIDTIFATAILFVACAEHVEAVPELMASVRHLLMDESLIRKVQALVAYLTFDDFLNLCQSTLREDQKLSLLLNLHDYYANTDKLSAVGSFILERFTKSLGNSVTDLDDHLAVLQVKQRIWQA
ncbi:MAG: hypothetical protein ACKO10_04680 [Betaproteobacteria bacterium]